MTLAEDPTDAEVASMAACLAGAFNDTTFRMGRAIAAGGDSMRWQRTARLAFEHLVTLEFQRSLAAQAARHAELAAMLDAEIGAGG